GPGGSDLFKMFNKQVCRDAQVLASSICIFCAPFVIRPRTRAWTGAVGVLPPKQEFDRMKSGTDIPLTLLLVLRQDQSPSELWKFRRRVDDTRPRIACDVVDIIFIDRPRIDESFDFIDGSVVKAACLRLE